MSSRRYEPYLGYIIDDFIHGTRDHSHDVEYTFRSKTPVPLALYNDPKFEFELDRKAREMLSKHIKRRWIIVKTPYAIPPDQPNFKPYHLTYQIVLPKI